MAWTSPLKIFELARDQSRFVYASAPMVRYSKLAFRQTVYSYGVDLCWTPMVLAKEFNRNQFARDSDFTLASYAPQPPTIVQFGSNSPLEFSRASSLVAPYVSGVDLNCGCPQSWACAEVLGAALMDRRELVRDMVVETRSRLRADGWAVALDESKYDPGGKSVSVKIRVHKDLRKTMDFIDTVVGHPQNRQIDFLTIHPRTRHTPSSDPINIEALEMLTSKYGDAVPILVSGDVFTLDTLPFSSPLLRLEGAPPSVAAPCKPRSDPEHSSSTLSPMLPKLAGLMSARAILANPALFSNQGTCSWDVVERFMNRVARAPLPLKLVQHHLTEMTGPGFGPDKRSLLNKKERMALIACTNMLDLIDLLDEKMTEKRGGLGLKRFTSNDGV
ncbi:tRNA-dihydrouridine synthase 4 [Magnaporthiopsis poae ATCC 64411]|uniref:tRNA-dihydrouridine synthase 4 n=1 Tax=Magnaporthiopsis poae (strain ATCC 64411 / 73-15) TaxID=644358 RepID=A0A0C4CSK7_MAGP6|nr:tRNA-dihydrouridine synthase 4, variant [Magnaporthiopsis poae ATCC 64411]KLU93124.1 tRNA-dihydrouridine synthase 4 [Magnaporthiopsis poae ATCC 64411]